MGKVGMPILLLKQGNGKTKRSGNAKAVALEALEERYSSDPDLDRTKTKDNIYMDGGFRSGIALSEYWRKQAEAFRVIDKNGKEKKLRSDASIAFANILKPDKEFMDSLTSEQQMIFLNDLIDITKEAYTKQGIKVDTTVIQVDEGNPHVHLFGHDPQYKLGKKLNLKFFNVLNREIPKQLRGLGWDIEDCSAYDSDAVKEMSNEDKRKYKEEHIERKKKNKHGKSAKQFKLDREKQALSNLEKSINDREIDLKAKEDNLPAEIEMRVRMRLRTRTDELEREKESVKELQKQLLELISDAKMVLEDAKSAFNIVKSDMNVLPKRKEIDQRHIERVDRELEFVKRTVQKDREFSL